MISIVELDLGSMQILSPFAFRWLGAQAGVAGGAVPVTADGALPFAYPRLIPTSWFFGLEIFLSFGFVVGVVCFRLSLVVSGIIRGWNPHASRALDVESMMYREFAQAGRLRLTMSLGYLSRLLSSLRIPPSSVVEISLL